MSRSERIPAIRAQQSPLSQSQLHQMPAKPIGQPSTSFRTSVPSSVWIASKSTRPPLPPSVYPSAWLWRVPKYCLREPHKSLPSWVSSIIAHTVTQMHMDMSKHTYTHQASPEPLPWVWPVWRLVAMLLASRTSTSWTTRAPCGYHVRISGAVVGISSCLSMILYRS